MADYQLLNPEKHSKLRVRTDYSKELGYGIGATVLMPSEMRAAQREYPIIFRKHPETGRFFPNALLGFYENENLFLDGSGHWQAEHIPLAVAKGPFMIGFQQSEKGNHPTAAIDTQDPRVKEGGEGEPLFEDDGSLSRYMKYISEVLLLLHQGAGSVTEMVDLFLEFDLIEPLSLDVQFNNGEKLTFGGGYTIADEKLAELSDEQVVKLRKSGFLSLAYYIAGSIENVHRLITMKNKLISES